jgi:hypothetical protein
MGAHDNLGVFSDAQSITAAGYSTKFIDMGVASPKLGVGAHAPMLCIKTNTAPTQATDTLSIEVRMSATVTADTDGGTLNGTIKYVFMPLCGAAGAEVLASDARLATAGSWIWRAALPYELNLRYVQLYYNNTVTNGAFVIDAWLEDAAPSDFRGSQVLTSPVGNP